MSVNNSATGIPRTDRGHHVPALTVTSGGRGVGSDVACSEKVLVDENGTESGGLLGRCLSPPVLPFVLFRFGGVQLKEEKGTDPRTSSDPKITF